MDSFSFDSFFLSAFIFLASAVLIVPLARKSGLGSVLGYLIAGILIGPYGLSLITGSEKIIHFAEFGVVLMLFLIGMELKPRTLWAMRASVIGLGGLQVVLTSMVLAAFISFYLPWEAALCAGMALSLSSTAMVLQIMNERKITKKKTGRNAFSVLLFQDVAIIPILALIPILASASFTPNGDDTAIWNNPLIEPLKIIGVVGLFVLFGRYAIQYAFHYISASRMREIFTASSLLLVIGITLLMHSLGLSAALGAFVAGVVLANSEYRHTLEADIEPFKGLLLGLFFISVGMSINFDLILTYPLMICMAVLALISIKAILLYGLAQFFEMSRPYRLTFCLILCQAGEFAFVITQAAYTHNIFEQHIVSVMNAIVALSMLCTPFLMLLNDRLSRFMYKSYAEDNPEFDTIDEEGCPVIIAGYGRFGQVVGRLLNAQGFDPIILEKSPEQISLLRRFGNKVYFGDAMRTEVLEAAGMRKAKIIVITFGDPNATLALTKLVRSHFPDIRIFTRARNRRHAYELHQSGAEVIRREVLDSSLWMGRRVLEGLGLRAYEARNKTFIFQKHDDEVLERSFEFFDDEKELINFSHQTKKELEQILADDRRSEHHAHYIDSWGYPDNPNNPENTSNNIPPSETEASETGTSESQASEQKES